MPVDVNQIFARNPHLKKYIDGFEQRWGKRPEFVENLSGALSGEPNYIYPVGDPIFIHVFKIKGMLKYAVIQPEMSDELKEKYEKLLSIVLKEVPREKFYENEMEFDEILQKLIGKATTKPKDISSVQKYFSTKPEREWVEIGGEDLKIVQYRIKQEIIEAGVIEPLLRDPYLEDIHSIGYKNIHVIHKVYGMVKTNLKFRDPMHLDHYLRSMSERMGRPVSDSRPIVDGTLPDGSRINIVYSEDVSKGGPSFTIRKFAEKPPTMPQLIKWGTFSSQLAAYLWIVLENGMSVFVSGETASGKTTSLNSLLNFIPYRRKVFTAEDTPEVVVPQPVWQRLITRETGPEESRVELFDLVRAALRSRPDLIIVGEIRGKEGNAAFQAMQTGHACMATFHASSISKMIQRFTGDPINVPPKFMDNLNVAIFQELLYIKGRLARRCTAAEEIVKYSEAKGGVLTRAMFKWDSAQDKHNFTGMYNSYILEAKIAEKLGYEDVREIYKDLDYRSQILDKLVENNIVGYDEVRKIFHRYDQIGFDAFPFNVKREKVEL